MGAAEVGASVCAAGRLMRAGLSDTVRRGRGYAVSVGVAATNGLGLYLAPRRPRAIALRRGGLHTGARGVLREGHL